MDRRLVGLAVAGIFAALGTACGTTGTPIVAPMEVAEVDAGTPVTGLPKRPPPPPTATAIAIEDERLSDKNCCAGKNDCKGKGGCKSDTHACRGQNDCKGQGTTCDPRADEPAYPTTKPRIGVRQHVPSPPSSLGSKHACKGQNPCKGQGGCKNPKNACKGQNSCKGQGGCKTG